MKETPQFLKTFLLLLLCIGSREARAQRSMTLAEAQSELRRNNLLLLAGQYDVSAAEAGVIQARIWDLPQAELDFNLINPQDKKVFDVGQNGQKAASVQQLIYIGGKKKAEVEFAKSNVDIARLQFEQLLRNLQLQLSQSFFTVYYDQIRLQNADAQIRILDTLLTNYRQQTDRGNVPLKELVRLETLVLGLRSNRNDLAREIRENQHLLSLLTGTGEEIRPVVAEAQLAERLRLPLLNRDSAVAYALQNNLDYRTSQLIAQSQELRLRWQRTLAIPDPSVGLSYDQNGGAFRNQVNLTLGIPIPLWNRNRGNIREAEARRSQSRSESDYRRNEIASLAATQYDIWLQENRQLTSISPTTVANLEAVYQGTVDNFRKRNISLLEFTDFVESYNNAINQFNDIRKGWILSALTLENTLNINLFQ